MASRVSCPENRTLLFVLYTGVCCFVKLPHDSRMMRLVVLGTRITVRRLTAVMTMVREPKNNNADSAIVETKTRTVQLALLVTSSLLG